MAGGMSDWTHAICDGCWDGKNPERPSPRSGTGEIEHCCYCGHHTASGIYLRDDPATIPAHEDNKRGVVVQ